MKNERTDVMNLLFSNLDETLVNAKINSLGWRSLGIHFYNDFSIWNYFVELRKWRESKRSYKSMIHSSFSLVVHDFELFYSQIPRPSSFQKDFCHQSIIIEDNEKHNPIANLKKSG